MGLRGFHLFAAAGVVAVLVLAGSAEALPAGCVASGSSVTCTYSYTGSAQTFTVPAGVNSITVDARGAAGGGGVNDLGAAGKGGEAAATLSVTAGQQLAVTVGGSGVYANVNAYGGGGSSGSGGGGGYSAVSVGATLEVLAGGGGGGGLEGRVSGTYVASSGGTGGAGGQYGTNGGPGADVTALGATLGGGGGGYAGDGSNPGQGGAAGTVTGTSTCAGAPSAGSPGGSGSSLHGGNELSGLGGGGGGGYTGGGAGGEPASDGCLDNGGGGGGGGGSSYVDASASGAAFSTGVQSGDGQVTISYVQSSSVCGTTLLTSFTLTASIDCSGWVGPALKIGQAGITVNLNGFTITGGPSGSAVIANPSGYDGLTVENGTIVANGGPGTAAIDNSAGGDGLVVSNMTIQSGSSSDAGGTGIDPTGSTGISITGNTMSGFRNDVVLTDTSGALVKGNTLTPYDFSSNNHCAGVREDHGTGDMVMGNTFTGPKAQDCYGLWTEYSAGTVFSGNTATWLHAGIKSEGGSAGLMITGNVFGGNYAPNNGNSVGVWISGTLAGDSGDVINGNYVRNSMGDGIIDLNSFNNTYTNNVLNANGYTISDNVYIDAGGVGPVTLVNNYSISAGSFGYLIQNAYSGTVPGGPYTLVSGNTALLNGSTGFVTAKNVGATFTNNIAGVINYGNKGSGFEFYQPMRNTISNNSATNNGYDGFAFEYNVAPYAPLAVTNNSATYNGVWGFHGAYPVAGSGNTGGNTNTAGDCLLVAGCS